PPPRVDPFFGMERDMGTFLGGIPLGLSAPPKPVSPFAESAVVAPAEEPEPPAEWSASQPAAAPEAEPSPEPLPALPEEDDQAVDLTETLPEPSTFVAPEVTEPEVTSHTAPAAPPKAPPAEDMPDLGSLAEEKLDFSGEPDELPPLDTLLADDGEPLELFDGTAEKLDELPDAMDAIAVVDGVLADE